jgi:putative endonuclease
MTNRKIDIRHFVFLPNELGNQESGKEDLIFSQLSTINYKLSARGGIAQLVERQLCKLEVRGSNPLASSLRSRRRGERRLSRRSLGVGGHLFGLLPFSRELRLGKPFMKKFFYVYILQSETEAQRFYTGLTNDLRTRLKAHDSSRIVHTAKWKPWRLKTYIALSDRTRAAQLERYLKSASGRAFIKSRL